MIPPENAKIMEFPTSIAWFDEDGILCSVSKDVPPLDLEGTKKIIEDFKKMIGNRKICMLIQSTNRTPPDKEMRDYLADEFPKFAKSIALLSPSPLTKMVANLFFSIKKQPYPTKFFNDEKEAKEWLKQYL
jgi:hypothetical protein